MGKKPQILILPILLFLKMSIIIVTTCSSIDITSNSQSLYGAGRKDFDGGKLMQLLTGAELDGNVISRVMTTYCLYIDPQNLGVVEF
jgi:hypothetical protein